MNVKERYLAEKACDDYLIANSLSKDLIGIFNTDLLNTTGNLIVDYEKWLPAFKAYIENHQHITTYREITSWDNGEVIYRDSLKGSKIKTFIEKAVINGIDLYYADLSWLDLRYADLSGANLSGAKLSRANLSDANLSDANLSDANLSGANLSWADLSWADLKNVNLKNVNLKNVKGLIKCF